MDKIIIVSCTTKSFEDFENKTPLGQSIKKLKKVSSVPIETVIFLNNTNGLCECYNSAIEKNLITEKHENAIFVFIHDDVYIEDSYFTEKIIKGLKEYDVVGVAGSSKWALRHPTVWHNVKCDWSGMVPHKLNGKYIVTKYGEYGEKCIVMDGLFLAVKGKTFIETPELRFDERLKFHHYDVDICLTGKKLNLKMTTIPLWLVHCSEGRWQDDPVWHESEKVILEKWAT